LIKIFSSKTIGLLLLVGSILVIVDLYSHSSAPLKPVSKYIPSSQSVCIDPGHGGNDPGAQAANLTEATINLEVAFKVRSELEAKGYPVYMTRTSDQTLSHAQRADFCNAHHATILVAIHQNAYPYSNADYSTALEYKPQDGALAVALAEAAGKELGLSVTPPSWFEGGVLMHSDMPATLIESLFITNTSEQAAFNRDSSRLNQEAQGIVNGIVIYLNGHKS